MKGFLLDTNVPSELTYPRPAPRVEQWLEDVTRSSWLDDQVLPAFAGRILPVTEPIAERMGRWAGEGETRGRTIRIADGLIAATALEHDLTLVTRNVKDFAGFGVPILNPWEA